MQTPPPERITPLNAPAAWVATGLGVSVGVPAPGTVGALWGVPIWVAISYLPSHPVQIGLILGLIALGVPICHWATNDLERLGHLEDRKDPQSITWDEFMTVPLVYAFAPAACNCVSWLAIGFALHRLFDITKPWPANQLERLPGAWGIVSDDVAAALYAGACYALLWRWWSG